LASALRLYNRKFETMKTKIISTAIITAGLLFTLTVEAQTTTKTVTVIESVPAYTTSNPYNTAIGVRAGETSGLTIKHFTGENRAIEAIVGIWPNALGLTALYEKHADADAEGLKWYYGGGGHINFATHRVTYTYREGERYVYHYYRNDAGFGIDGILGLEYKIPQIPFALSLDIKPFLEISNTGIVYVSLDPGLGIKVTIK
jgi:hypothetical protein